MRSKAGLWITILIVLSLAIGVLWTIRTAPPSPKPWWWGKNPDFNVEVWEPGKDKATVAMTMPKKTVDALVAFGLKSEVSSGHHKVYLNDVRDKVERLPQGQWLTVHEDEAVIYVWLDTKEGPPTRPPKPFPATPSSAATPTGR